MFFGRVIATVAALVMVPPGCSTDDTSTNNGAAGAAGSADAAPAACTARPDWSFFVVSLEAIKREAGNDEGLGGNLGGLAGADAICQRAAEHAHGACGQKWVAFLSVTDDGTGKPVNAIDRIGEGPWHDVNGRLLAENKEGMLHTRPRGDDQTVVYDSGFTKWVFTKCLTTELGNCTLSYGDSHDTLTGSNRQGLLFSSDKRYTCNDWTSTDVEVQVPIGHTWPRQVNATDDAEANWLWAHSNCGGGAPEMDGGVPLPEGGPPEGGAPPPDGGFPGPDGGLPPPDGGFPGPDGGFPGADGGVPPGMDGGGSTTCRGCAANINLTDTFEEGVGGDGGYGAFYCFAAP
jgi:hypothetical protein